MNTTGFIARRYLFSKKHISLISTLTMISITGVTIGTALLIVVLSVFNGFFNVIQGLLLQNDPDIRIEAVERNAFMLPDDLQKKIANIPEIHTAASYVEGKALLAYEKESDQVVRVKGINPSQFIAINNLKENISSGRLDLAVKEGQPGMMVSQQLMRKMNLQIGDRVVLLSADGMRKSLTQFSLPRSYRFRITGVYSGLQITNTPAVLIDLEAAQRLFEVKKGITGVDIRLQQTGQANKVKEKLQQEWGDNYEISTWYDLQKPLYDIMYIEKWGSYLVLMIIIIVAVLNIVGSLFMIVIQKNRDIAILKTMGFTPRQVKEVFVRQGLYIGLIGCFIGGGLGLLLSWLQKQYGLIKLSSAFIIDAYPVSINYTDVSIVLFGSLILCILASWYPAKQAAEVKPADAIRYD